jgi:Protein of unknown function (DUF2939)
VKKIFLAIVVVAFGIYFYNTPRFAIYGLRSAADLRDPVKIAKYVDFPSLRESFKDIVKTRMEAEVAKISDPLAKQAAAATSALLTRLTNAMVDALLTPEAMAHMMDGDKSGLKGAAGQPAPKAETNRKVDYKGRYEGFNHYTVQMKNEKGELAPVLMVFTRDGLLSWKLSGIRLLE